ncbi:2-phospho-L-lactate guanylyltransferase [Pseudolysinimonas sp.]|uniref:2-phospho-L-lactate guanylyltransferase n=1 Tax=Pseudolysinimonas sp. TaxID=2680009 RepID=UPI003F8130E8
MWTLIVPVKPADIGKSRLGAEPGLVRAIALDTIDAALATPRVGRVLVVTSDRTLATEAEIVAEVAPRGLRAAIATGLATAGHDAPRAVLLGDLPALRPEDLEEALRRAAAVPTGFVADREGTGTTLVTAQAGIELRHAFGPESARRHRELALAELVLPAGSTVPLDVDTPEQLAATAGLGPRTAAELAAAAA